MPVKAEGRPTASLGDPTLNVLRLFELGPSSEVKLVGTAGGRNLYSGDFDALVAARVRGPADAAQRLQLMTQRILNTPLTILGDVKAGEDEMLRVLPKAATIKDMRVVGYDHEAAQRKVHELREKELVTADEANEALDAIRKAGANPTVKAWLFDIVPTMRWHVLRWKAHEILKGEKGLRSSRVTGPRSITLADGCAMPALVKWDIVTFAGGFAKDASAIFQLYVGNKLLNDTGDSSPAAIVHSLGLDVLELLLKRRFLKLVKRMASQAKMLGKMDVVAKLNEITNSPGAGHGYLVSSLLTTLAYWFEHVKHGWPWARAQQELQHMKVAVSQVAGSLSAILPKEHRILKLLDVGSRVPHTLKGAERLAHALTEAEAIIMPEVHLEAERMLRERGLLPLPRWCLP